MHPRLRANVLRPHKAIVDALIESMDMCDTTRPHLPTPFLRWQSTHATRRTMRRLAISLLGAAALVALAAATSR